MEEEAFVTYDEVIEHCEWLEDKGDCSRYLSNWDSEGATWVCHVCMSIIDDPDEHECD